MTPHSGSTGDFDTTGYDLAVVSFIDILGFSSVVRERSAPEIAEALRLLRRTTEVGSNEDRPEVRHYAFSDNIVRVRPIITTPQEALGLEANDIGLAQVDLYDRGIVVRGGISMGYVYADALNCFGPALNRAYWIETELAIYPRVLLDPALRSQERLIRNLHSASERAIVRVLCSPFRDGLMVDYLTVALDELDETADVTDFLKAHRRIVEAGLSNSSPRVRTKYAWMMRYHNQFVMRNFGFDAGRTLLCEHGLSHPERDRLWQEKVEWIKRGPGPAWDGEDEDNGDLDDDADALMLMTEINTGEWEYPGASEVQSIHRKQDRFRQAGFLSEAEYGGHLGDQEMMPDLEESGVTDGEDVEVRSQ